MASRPDPDFRKPEFSLAQLAAADTLRTTAGQGGYTVTLLDGVTGSGKTEVYFEAVAETVARGRQSLILMPEIALTGQFLDQLLGLGLVRIDVRALITAGQESRTPIRHIRDWQPRTHGDESR